MGFEEELVRRLSLDYGKSFGELARKYGLCSNAKNKYELLLAKMLGIDGKISNYFQKYGIRPKTIRVQQSGMIKESMSFQAFKFKEIVNDNWNESDLRRMLVNEKFMFIVFKQAFDDDYVFHEVRFWTMPACDLDEVRRVWEQTVRIIRNGVIEFPSGKNNLPKQSESRVAHVRPHARNADDVDQLPDGRWMTKQCFWLNNSYIESIIGL